jgi:hypothetical protein
MAPLAGLTGFNAQAPDATDEGVLEAHGGPVDPSHGTYGQDFVPTWPAGYGSGYDGTQYGPDIALDPRDYQAGASGHGADETPTAHASPYPRGIQQPDYVTPGSYGLVAEQLALQRSQLHGASMGAVEVHNRAVSGRESPVNYTVDRYSAPNQTGLASVPGQLRQGNNGAGRDTSQGYGALNSTQEFAEGHSIRIVQHDSAGFDNTLANSPPRPFNVRWPQRQASFDGPDSPYGIYGDTTTGQQIPWEGHIGDPTAYVQPPETAVGQPAGQAQDTWAYYG